MKLDSRIDLLTAWASILDPRSGEVTDVAQRAYEHNKWFTPENIFLALKNIREQFLQKEKLEEWSSGYGIPENLHPKTVGLVMAGNIPLAGFHDLLSVMLSGHRALIKLSSKDDILLPWMLKKLFDISEEWRHRLTVSELLRGMDAVIATGSDNSSRYFKYYFGKYPHIIRKNRGSVAVLSGNESQKELSQLGNDVFSYFGLGCRNVSKLMVPEGYSFDAFFEAIEPFRYVIDHNKYKNNYDYNRTLLLMNKMAHLSNEFLMLAEDERIVSAVAMVHYEFYGDENELSKQLTRDEEKIQCVVGSGFIPFGKAQLPELRDYADKVDTMAFLVNL